MKYLKILLFFISIVLFLGCNSNNIILENKSSYNISSINIYFKSGKKITNIDSLDIGNKIGVTIKTDTDNTVLMDYIFLDTKCKGVILGYFTPSDITVREIAVVNDCSVQIKFK